MGIRIDAWLWAARFFKTRTLAKKSCDLNRIVSNGQVAKAGLPKGFSYAEARKAA